METNEGENLRDDRMSKCQSFGSSYFPSSQTKKISIGITVNSLAKKILAHTEEDEAAVPNAERRHPYKENLAKANNRNKVSKTATAEKQTEATENVSSPWITTRSLNQNATTLETVLCKKQTSRRPSSGWRQKKVNGLKDAQTTQSVQFFANKSSIQQSGDSNQKKFDGVTYKRKGRKKGNSACAEEITFATTHEVMASDKGMTADKNDKMENGRTETLKMELWKILGTVSPSKSLFSNPPAVEQGADKLKPEKVVDQIGEVGFKPRQYSDTIETDSESPNESTRRPLTRSLMRKRASTKVPKNQTNTDLSSSYKQKHQTTNIFSFEEGWSTKLDSAINLGSSMSTKNKIHLKSFSIEPRKICLSGKDNADKPLPASYTSELPSQGEKTSSLGNILEKFHGCMAEDRGDCLQSKNLAPGKNFCQSPEPKKMDQRSDFDSTALTENKDHQEDCGNPSSKKVVVSPDKIQSPTFAFNTPILSPSPFSTPTTVQIKQQACGPAIEDRIFNVGNIRTFRTLKTSNPDCSGSDEETKSPDDAEKFKESPARRASPVKEKNNAVNGQDEFSSESAEHDLGEWSSEDGDPGSSGKCSSIIKEYDRHKGISPENGTAEKPNFMSYPTKRLLHSQGISHEFSPPLPSPKGIGESEWFQEPPEQSQMDDLGRAVTLLASALDNFRRKMDSARRKKSSDILISISEGLHSQLQNFESQIQTDVGKLIILSKSKRKRLETRFEEQQEQLKLIHKKFKEDVHHHLQNCTNTLEELETHQIELKGSVKKQRTSHQKLLLQLEEAVETQLNDAQRRITTVHELARTKMLQLKHLIAECLKEGI